MDWAMNWGARPLDKGVQCELYPGASLQSGGPVLLISKKSVFCFCVFFSHKISGYVDLEALFGQTEHQFVISELGDS